MHFFDTRTRRRVGAPYRMDATIATLRFSPDGSRLAVEGLGFDGATIDLVDVGTRRAIAARCAGGPQLAQRRHAVLAGLGDPDGRLRGDGRGRPVCSAGRLGPAIRSAARRRSRDPRFTRWSASSTSGAQLLTWTAPDDRMIVRDASRCEPLRHIRGAGAASPLRSPPTVASRPSAATDGAVRFVDLRTGRTRTGTSRHEAGRGGAQLHERRAQARDRRAPTAA